ncbi:MAG: Fe-S cluster assembly protein SufB [Acidimicrobiia bacterium]|nr:Fe-S cluster assembly protein SufB [Acidimicrobiia bacterium]MDX2466043.1 Fe-S cluster assembly protein SufB [Acidimicrobiia bacterium]
MVNRPPEVGTYRLGWHDQIEYEYSASRGLDELIVRDLSARKGESQDVLDRRLAALEAFLRMPMPVWGGDGELENIDFDDIRYYMRPTRVRVDDWDEVPITIRDTFERLDIPQAEEEVLAGVSAQYDSEVVYHHNRAELDQLGVIFTDMDTAVRQHWDLVGQYLGTVVPFDDNKFAALNAAVWSGGSFLYVPAGVHVDLPVQAYFRINADRLGQFERTLVVVEEGAFVHYIDGCSAANLSAASLHAGVIEAVVKRGARCRITGLQNWSKSVYNLVTKRAVAHEEATMEWIDGNIGARLTMNYPSVILSGSGAHGEVLSIGYAGRGQYQDTGAKMIHLAPGTTSLVTSKSICRDGGRAGYRGVVHIEDGARGSRSFVRCDSLILDSISRTDTHPTIEDGESESYVGHEATVSRVSDDQLFYMMSRGLSENEAVSMLIAGFVEPILRELPLACAVEINNLIALDMEAAGAVG